MEHILKFGQFFDLPYGKDFIIAAVGNRAGICRCVGNWGDELGETRVFSVYPADGTPINGGDPVNYERNADFDNHYHDCDEYWIIFQGSGIAYSAGKRFEVGVGDCVATERGYHHDFPIAYEPIGGIF